MPIVRFQVPSAPKKQFPQRKFKLDHYLNSGQIAISIGRGNGTFSTNPTISTSFKPGSFVAGDFNGDGQIDLALSPTIASVSPSPAYQAPFADVIVLRGKGDGTFQAAMVAGNSAGPLFAAADMNHDGKLDLIIGNSVLTGIGNATFRAPVFFGLTTYSCAEIEEQFPCAVNSTLDAVVADLNGDGALDLISPYSEYQFPHLIV